MWMDYNQGWTWTLKTDQVFMTCNQPIKYCIGRVAWVKGRLGSSWVRRSGQNWLSICNEKIQVKLTIIASLPHESKGEIFA